MTLECKNLEPKVGETRFGREINKKPPRHRFVWHACIDCGKERWVQLIKGEPESLRCRSCVNRQKTGLLNSHWKGGQCKSRGYVFILKPEHPKANSNGYIKRARLILEERLGRPLLRFEDSHHINGIRDDDRPENLMALTHSQHISLRKIEKNQVSPDR